MNKYQLNDNFSVFLNAQRDKIYFVNDKDQKENLFFEVNDEIINFIYEVIKTGIINNSPQTENKYELKAFLIIKKLKKTNILQQV